MSVDTHLSRRKNLAAYEAVAQDGITLLVPPALMRRARHLAIDLKQFLFLKHLQARAELSNGAVVGRNSPLEREQNPLP